MERRTERQLMTADISLGYVRMVPAWRLVTPWLMHGEDFNTPYCPVEFR